MLEISTNNNPSFLQVSCVAYWLLYQIKLALPNIGLYIQPIIKESNSSVYARLEPSIS